jgi:hypothetical protein
MRGDLSACVRAWSKYHATTTNKMEKWLFVPLSDSGADLKGAFSQYGSWCSDGKTPLNRSLTYQMTLRALSMNESLILEALRALHSDIPRVTKSSVVCAEREAEAAKIAPRAGGCSNLLLDDFTGNYLAAYEQ